MKLKMRLIVLNTIMFLISIIVISTMLLFSLGRTEIDSATEIAGLTVDKYSDAISGILNQAADDTEELTVILESIKQGNKKDRQVVIDLLQDMIDSNPYYQYTWVAFEPNAFDAKDRMSLTGPGSDENGRFMPAVGRVGDEFVLEPCFDVENSPYYKIPKETQKTYITNPTSYELAGEMVSTVSFSRPLIINNKFIGVVGVDISLNQFHQMQDLISVTDNSFGQLMNKDGVIISHYDEKMINAVNNTILESGLSKQLQQNELIEREVKNDYIDKKAFEFYKNIPIEGFDQSWTFSVIVPSKDLLKTIYTEIIKLAIVVLIILILVVVVIYKNGLYVVKSVGHVSKELEQLSNYDLTIEENKTHNRYLKQSDEIGIMTQALDKMKKNFSTLIFEVQNVVNHVSTSAEELTATAQQVALSSEEIASTVSELAKGALDQASDTEKGVDKVSEVGEGINKNSHLMVGLTEATEKVHQEINTGINVVKDLILKSDESGKATTEINEAILKTNASSVEIRQASEMIASIAEQTNLLALNAAIEAARAGEAGRGFAVVAEEIRKLAEQSTKSTQVIDNIVETLISNSNDAVSKVSIVKEIVEAQMVQAADTEDKFNTISESIVFVDKAVNSMSENVKMMETNKVEILEVMQSLSAISEENAASTEEASASTEEQLASIQEVSSASESLAEAAETLELSIAKFKL
ncbi:MAG: methyl-accepting chemotaxis protein [Clostridiales bacterium]|nr:methyl-accepting chemotaxis protein [Clostridiales bacterium]